MDTIDICPLCSSTDFVVITEQGDKFTEEKVNICTGCSLVFLSPRMIDLDDYYESGGFDKDFRTEHLPTQAAIDKTFGKMENVWGLVKQFLPEHGYIHERGHLLDVGCGMGAFIQYASEQFDVMGIEPAPSYLHWAQMNNPVGDNIVQGVFPDILADEWRGASWDVISVFHVLEHIPDPVWFLGKVHDFLNDDGIFILEYPDIWKATGRQLLLWNYFQRSHLFDFNLYAIQPLLESIGFEVEQVLTYGEGFPLDKNVLLVLRKTEPKEVEYNAEFATTLQQRLQNKIQSFSIARKSPIRIMHVASHNINIGDGAISAGIRDFFKSTTDAEIEFAHVDIVDMRSPNQYFSSRLINEMNPDLVVVGGGGTIDGHQNRVHTGTAFNMPIEEIEQLNMPIAFCALGHNLFPNQEFYQINKLQQLIDLCDSRGFPFSVRRDRSLERLSKVLDTKHVTAIPDPAFFLRANSDYNPAVFQPRNERPTAVFQLTADGIDNRFGSGEAALEYFEQVSEVIEWLIEQGYSIVLALHTVDDLFPAHIVRGHVSRPNARYYLRTTAANVHPEYAHMFFSTYAHANLVVGMRGHSIICSAGMQKPFVALSTHDKVSGFLDEIGCADYGIEQGPDLVNRLKAAIIDVMEDPRRQSDAIAIAADPWAKELSDFAYSCLELV